MQGFSTLYKGFSKECEIQKRKHGSKVTLYFSVQLINGSDLLQLIAQIYYKSSMTVHKRTQMYEYESFLYYKYSIPPTRFGH